MLEEEKKIEERELGFQIESMKKLTKIYEKNYENATHRVKV